MSESGYVPTLRHCSNPNWDYNTLTVDDVFRAIQSNPGEVDVSGLERCHGIGLSFFLQNHSFNYTSYFAGGGKLLHYAGLADQIISSGNSVGPRIPRRIQRLMSACI
jgi:hypothetical protein